MPRHDQDLPNDARITDPYVRRMLEVERVRSGDSTITKTATRLVLERLAQLELISRGLVEDITPRVAEPAATSAA